MKRSRLTSLSIDDLLKLREDVSKMLTRKVAQTRKELLAKLASLGGGKPAPSRAAGRSPLKGRKVPAKYRNPKKRSETWAGRGAMPRWLRAQIKAGKKLEAFAVRRGRPRKAA